LEDFVATLEKEFESQINQNINNPLVKLAEREGLTVEHLREIAKQEYYIAPQEFRHMGLCMARTGRSPPPGDLRVQRTLLDILSVFLSDWEAYEEFVHTLGLTLEDVRRAKVLPGAQYFISWSHFSGSALDPEQHIAFIYINWIAWGRACTNLVRVMNREQSRFKPDEIKFLTLFTYTNDVLNQKMKDVVNEYARSDENKAKLRWAVKLGLDAEKMFWNDIADFGKRSDPFSI
jgi:pyrroloquinoline quinone (PQQ) biosynthesis protein C